MSELVATAGWWWLGTALGGGAVLLLAALLIHRMPTSDSRQRLGEWGVAAALAVAAIRLGPAWLPITIRDSTPASAAIPTAGELLPPAYPAESARVFRVREHGPIEYTTTPAAEWIPTAGVNSASNIASGPSLPNVGTMVLANASGAQSGLTRWPNGYWAIQACLITYAAFGGMFLVRWLAGQWALSRLVGRSRCAPDSVQQLFDLMAASLNQPARLCVSDQVRVPVCWGLRRPVVVLPRRLAEATELTELRWVFAHELTHLSRRDPWSCWAFGMAQAVYFYLPWFWWLKRQVRLCQEFVADAAAAAQGRWADEYAQFLVSLARSPAAPVGAMGVIGNKSDLYRRITMLLQKEKANGRSATGPRLATAIGCLVVVGLLSSGVGIRAQSPKSGNKDDNVQVKVIVVEDDDKDSKEDKDSKKEKKVIRSQAIVLDGDGPLPFPGFDPAAMEKRLREALKKADLSDDQIDKVVKDLHKGLHQRLQMAGPGAPGPMTWNAMPGDVGRFRVLQSMAGGGRLGIMIEPVSPVLADQLNLPKELGLVIRDVIKGSAAEKAGLKANDILLKFDGNDVKSDPGDFVKMVEKIGDASEVEAVVLRKGKKVVVGGIKLAERKDVLLPTAPGDAHGFVFAGPGGFGGGKGQRTVSVTVKDGDYTAKDSDGDVTITITGSIEGKKVDVAKITINDGESTDTYNSVDKVPAKYRERVKKVLANSGDPVKAEFKRKKIDE